MKFIVDDCMDAVLGDTKLSGNVMLRYSSVCHDDVTNLSYGLLCDDGEWPSQTGSSSRLSLPRLNSAAHFFIMLYEGAFSPKFTTMSLWISLGFKPLRLS